jgi:hypothetical protein
VAQNAGVLHVADHQRDFRGQLAGGDGLGDGEEIGTLAGA